MVVPLAVWVVNRSPSSNCDRVAAGDPGDGADRASACCSDSTHLLPWSALLEAALYFYAAGSLISYMLHDHRVTGDELFAAGATFTLLAWGFAYAYFVCQAWYPGSFTGAVEPERPRALDGTAVPQLHHAVRRRAWRHPAARARRRACW